MSIQDKINSKAQAIAELQAEIKSLEAEAKSKTGLAFTKEESTCSISSYGDINTSPSDDKELAQGNGFKDKVSASLELQRRNLAWRMAKAASECEEKVDWEDFAQIKYTAYWSYKTKEFLMQETFEERASPLPYFTSIEVLCRFMYSLSYQEQELLLTGGVL